MNKKTKTQIEVKEVVNQLGLDIEAAPIDIRTSESSTVNTSLGEEQIKESISEENKTKRNNGKKVEWYVEGKLKDTFASIKATAIFFKETKGLKSMPFTPIMKSIREDKNWDDNSFKFAEG